MLIDSLRQDLRYGWRQLLRAPMFTIIASFSVAIGVIVAVSAFTLLNAILFKAPPLPDADQIHHVFTSDRDGRDQPYGTSSFRDYEDFAKSGAFVSLAASSTRTVAAVVGDQPPMQQNVGFVSDNYFDVLGLPVASGNRLRAGNPLEIVITYPYWRRQFGKDPGAIGQTISVNSFPLTIVGVAPESFRGVRLDLPVIGWAHAAALPMVLREENALTRRGARSFNVFGRLQDSETPERAAARLNAIAASLAQQEPAWLDANRETRLVSVLTHRESVIPPRIRAGVFLMAGLGALGVAFVVLLACTNVAALLLGRAVGREAEIAVRLTLGASRARLMRQLLTESVLLAGIGGALSSFGLLWTIGLVRRLPIVDMVDLRPDWRVLLAAITTCVLCALVFGLAPAYQTLRIDLRSRFGGSTVRRNRMRGALIAFQVAISGVLIVLALSAVRGVRSYVASNPGVELDGLVSVHIDMNVFGDDRARSNAYLTEVRELLTSMPGVEHAASTELLPLGDGFSTADLELAGGTRSVVEVNTVGRDFFATVGVRAVRGRVFERSDRRGGIPVAVVNPAFVQRYGELLGQPVKLTENAGIQIVGVVPEIQYHDAKRSGAPLIYVVDDQFPRNSSRERFLLRVAPGTERAIAADLRARLRQRFPDLVPPFIEAMREHTARQTMPHRIAGRVALGVGAVELGLASVGLYGLLLFALIARRREIGVRLVLGASPREASWAVMRDGIRYAGLGLAGAIVLAIPASIIAAQVLPGARSTDPIPLIIALSAVLAAAALAAYLPARRAGQVQPAAALRHD